jgi:hypothetical protein
LGGKSKQQSVKEEQMVTSKDAIEFSELQALGVPLDGEVLERTRTAAPGLNIQIFPSAAECTILDAQYGGTFLMIRAIISNDSPRVIQLNQCRIKLPWHDSEFRLLEDPWRKMPREHSYSSPNVPTLSFEREVVLNHRFGHEGRLNPGDSLDGMILGVGSQVIPDQYHDRQEVDVQLVIIDGQGKMYKESPRVLLNRSEELRRQRKARERACARNRPGRKLIKEKAPA